MFKINDIEIKREGLDLAMKKLIFVIALIMMIVTNAYACEVYRANTSVYVRRLDTGSVAGCFYSGDSIPVNGKRGNWYTFNYNGIAYKVYAKYVTKSYDRNENDVDAKIHKSRSMGEILDGGVYSNTIKKHKISKDSNDWSWVEVFF